MPTTEFASLALKPELIENLKSLDYHEMTPIQQQSLPAMLQGNDVIAQAQTGSGKTAAFGLALLHKLNVKRFRIQTLVLCPTRELADQVAKEIRRLARTIHNIKVLTLCGGMPFGPQIGSLEHGAHIVVGTPGRIEEHLRKGNLNLKHVDTLILDEADRMLEMGFQEALDTIIEQVPSARQTLLFSATYPNEIQAIAKRVMQQPVMVEVASTHDESSIEQHFYQVNDGGNRITALQLLIKHHKPASTLIFCNTKKETQQVADALTEQGFSAIALHGDLEQRERDETLVKFANNSAAILVATDVAARGLDIDALDAVINFQVSRDPEVHVHRIGRTGRAGNQGIACSLYSEKEAYKLSLIEAYSSQPLIKSALPPSRVLEQSPPKPKMTTIQINGGKKQKVRPGDILGALTADKSIFGNQVGKIAMFPNCAYVAVESKVAKHALKLLGLGKIKGKTFRARIV